jgi:hypothetical protein
MRIAGHLPWTGCLTRSSISAVSGSGLLGVVLEPSLAQKRDCVPKSHRVSVMNKKKELR